MKNFIQKTTLHLVATVNDSGDEIELDESLVSHAPVRSYWQQVLTTDGTLKPWSECGGITFGVFGAPNWDTATDTGVIEWLLTAARGHVPGLLQLGYFLSTNITPDEPDSVVDYTLDDGTSMQATGLRIDSYDSTTESPPLYRVAFRWLPSKLADLA